MEFLNKVGSKIGKTAKIVTKKSEDIVEITKLNLTIGNEEDKIKKLLTEMGSEVFGRFVQGESFDQYFNDKCVQIRELEKGIDGLREKVKNLKGHRTCGDCCTQILDNAKYCPNCGNKSETQE